MGTKVYPGIYRGIVKIVEDEQRRYRMKVRVAGVDWDETSDGNLRWSEQSAGFSSLLAADIPHYNVGDQVWVMYEHGDPDFPVVVGGWVNSAMGFSSVPTSQVVDANARQRWLRIDRRGNLLELSEVPEELWLRLKSGSAEIKVCQADNSVRLWAKSGTVDTQAARHSSTATVAQHTAQQFFITASDYDTLGGGTGLLQLLSNYNIDIFSGPGVNGRINIGGFVPTFQGVTDPLHPQMDAKQTDEVNVISREVNIGAATGDAQGLPPVALHETEKTNVKGKSIRIVAAPTTKDAYPSTAVSVVIDVTAGTITLQSDTKITLEAPEVDITGSAKVVVSAPEVEVTAAVSVTVSAPSIVMGGP